jgi:membrane protein implicated in regulation of membrane protease activity
MLAPGDPVVVEHVRGLTLTVRPAEDWEVLA